MLRICIHRNVKNLYSEKCQESVFLFHFYRKDGFSSEITPSSSSTVSKLHGKDENLQSKLSIYRQDHFPGSLEC